MTKRFRTVRNVTYPQGMNPPGRARMRRTRWVVLAGVFAVAVVCAAAFWRPAAAPATPVAAEQAADAAAPAPAALTLPESPRVLIFGDSWTYGSAATVPTLGYAYVIAERLGWQATVAGVRGSGYLKQGLDGGTYGERIALLDPALDPDLIVLEGSINDRRLWPDGYTDAVTAAWDAIAALYPHAQIVVLGPAPQVLPVEKPTAAIDRDLAELAAARSWWYISPIADEWITDGNYLSVIDTSDIGRDHPSTEGHAYLAERLAEALDDLRGSPIVADAPRNEEPLLP